MVKIVDDKGKIIGEKGDETDMGYSRYLGPTAKYVRARDTCEGWCLAHRETSN